MNILEALKSKRVWTLIVMFLVNGIAGISDHIAPGTLAVINSVLLALGIIFGLPVVKSF